jgi:putative ATPase
LFDDALTARLREVAPLAEVLRPRRLADVVGQDHLVGPDGPLRHMAQSGRLASIILWGPAGTGKTTVARLLATEAGYTVVTLSAVSSGVKDIRDVLADASRRLAEHGQQTCLFIDEVHRFNKAQQDLLLPATESGAIVLIGATTENPYFEVNAALMSRTTLWRLQPHSRASIEALVDRAVELRGRSVTPQAVDLLVRLADGDGRVVLTTLDVAFVLADMAGEAEVTGDTITRARDGRVMHQNDDSHYDQVSALIKSIRGSDPDAALFWLVALLEAGESARFLARRLVILASEDIGVADPTALLTANAAARAVDFVGLPEARLTLAHATVVLALAPKSNAITTALARATDAVRSADVLSVPPHLRDAHYRAANGLGHGEGYRYPHDFAGHWVEQDYMDPAIGGRPFYEPSTEGREPSVAQQWRARQGFREDPPVE